MKRALAHGVHEDTGIIANIRTEPVSPTEGQEINFYFTFQDSDGQFNLQQCDCTVVIFKTDTNGSEEIEVDRQLLENTDQEFAGLGSIPLYTQTFADSGNYILEINGTPKDGAVFRDFAIDYNFEISESSSESFFSDSLNSTLLGSGLVIAIALLACILYKNRKKNN